MWRKKLTWEYAHVKAQMQRLQLGHWLRLLNSVLLMLPAQSWSYPGIGMRQEARHYGKGQIKINTGNKKSLNNKIKRFCFCFVF